MFLCASDKDEVSTFFMSSIALFFSIIIFFNQIFFKDSMKISSQQFTFSLDTPKIKKPSNKDPSEFSEDVSFLYINS